ncbi:MAG: cation transporting ATPase C-terminal domain-containing protein, partial [Candidatus Sericytochromatia bacterium]|nr:cation transporting ATPase C-terminal domain-containing protein [Candidatus Sericytochromatia bacterium]
LDRSAGLRRIDTAQGTPESPGARIRAALMAPLRPGEVRLGADSRATLVYAELMKSFSARSETRTIFEVGLFSNLKLLASVAVALVAQPWMHHSATLQAFFRTVSMSWFHCGMLVLVGMAPVLVLEVIKVIRRQVRPG